MKKFLSIILLVCALGVISSCDGNAQSEDGFVMTATVKNLGEKLEVDVIKGEYGAEGIYLIIVSDSTEITNARGKKIDLDKINVGDTVEITYSGQVMMSYPPQVAARKIKLK